jgi:hypothetical protein
MPKWVPEPTEIVREALILGGGALLMAAAWRFLAPPGLKDWVAANLPGFR